MLPHLCRPFALLALLALAVPMMAAEPMPPKPKPDPIQWPAGSIIVISDKPAEALQRPDVIVLTADEYKKLRDEIERLSKSATPDKPELPSRCTLSGSAESRGGQEWARMTAVFTFDTAQPRTRFALGLRQANIANATTEDKRGFNLVSPRGDDGYTVQFDGPGPHKLTLDFEVPVSTRRVGERGFTLDLPGAAITAVERFTAPAGVKKASVGSRPWSAESLANPPVGVPALQALGPVTRFDLSWEVPAAAPTGPPALAAEARITVRVDDTSIETNAILTLRQLVSGTASEWQLILPGSGVSVTAELMSTPDRPVESPTANPVTVEKVDERKGIWKVRTKEATTQDVRVEVAVRQQRPQPPVGKPADPKAKDASRGPFAIGPFAVVGSFRQRGTITVTTPPHLQPRYLPRGELRRETLPGDSLLADAVFAYGSVPLGPDKGPSPLLEMEIEAVVGSVQSQLTHALTLSEAGWRLKTEVVVTAGRAELQKVEIEVPPTLKELFVGPGGEVESGPSTVREGPSGWRLLRYTLAPGRPRPTHLVIEGLYAHPPGPGEAELLLPRLAGTQDHAGEVTVSAPEGWELVGSVREWEGDRVGGWIYGLSPPFVEGKTPAPNVLARRFSRTLGRVDLAWRAFRPELAAKLTADVTLNGRQAAVRLQIGLSGPGVSRPITLVGPTSAGLRCVEGGVLRAEEPGTWTLTPTGAVRETANVTLVYALPLPLLGETPVSTDFPLVWPTATRSDATVRFWAGSDGPGWRPGRVTNGPWLVEPPSAVADRDVLPIRVLSTGGQNVPLAVELEPATASRSARAVLERGLIQVWLGEAGQQVYRARYLLQRVSGPLDLDLPASPAALGLKVLIDGRLTEAVTEGGRTRVEVPADAASRPLVLELQGQLTAADRPTTSRGWPGEVVFTPPRLLAVVPAGPVRWQFGLVGSPVPLYLGDEASAEQRWTWARTMFAPVPTRNTADLERWFTAGGEEETESSTPIAGEAVLLLRQPAVGPIRLVLANRAAWLMVCSLAALGAGLLLALCGPSRLRFWMVAAVLAMGTVPVAVFWPQTASQALAAAQPGLAVLAAVLLGQALWGWLARRRRRVLRGFSRARTGSSLARPSTQQRRREPVGEVVGE